jgi:NMD protein affecting ribosome stability and mRNA decay
MIDTTNYVSPYLPIDEWGNVIDRWCEKCGGENESIQNDADRIIIARCRECHNEKKYYYDPLWLLG